LTKTALTDNMCFDIEWECQESQIGSSVQRMRFSAKYHSIQKHKTS
jgi:hypothetical protein